MCRSLNNQAHRLLTIIREWKWQLEMEAAASRSRRCRQAAAGGDPAGQRRQMSAVMTRKVVAPFPCRHQNTENTRHRPRRRARQSSVVTVLDAGRADVKERSRIHFLLH